MEGRDRNTAGNLGFDASTLVYWRRRLAKSERPHRINDAVKQVVEQTAILRGRRKRAVDSTILADAVATQDVVTQLSRRSGVCAGRCPVRRSRSRRSAQAMTTASRANRGSTGRSGRQGCAGVGAGQRRERAAGGSAEAELDQDADAEFGLALLPLVAGQDVESAEGSDGTDGRWRIARRVAPDRVVSMVDPDARHTRKSPENRRDGYRAHVAAESETGIVTDES